MKKHIIRMIIGCILPLLLIFLVPLLGFGAGGYLFIFILAMFACHLLMPMHHGKHRHEQDLTETSKSETHAHH